MQLDSPTFQPLNSEHGVPQVLILGPVFLLYINDLSIASSLLYFILFSDDSNVLVSPSSYEQLFQMINLELPLVNYWFKANKLIIIEFEQTLLYYLRKHQSRQPDPKNFLESL